MFERQNFVQHDKFQSYMYQRNFSLITFKEDEMYVYLKGSEAEKIFLRCKIHVL